MFEYNVFRTIGNTHNIEKLNTNDFVYKLQVLS